MYLTYADYQAMGGTLTEGIFIDYAIYAESIINHRTFNRLKKDIAVPKQVKALMKRIIDLVTKKSYSMSLGKSSASSNIYITSQSNDGVSTSYSGMSSTDLFTLCDSEIQQAIDVYLSDVTNSLGQKLLYRGLYKGE